MVEQIELVVDESKAVRAIDKANKGIEKFEKDTGRAGKAGSQAFDGFSLSATRTEASLKSTERALSNLERKAALAGKSGVALLREQERQSLGRFGGTPEAVARIQAAFTKLRTAQEDIIARNVRLGESVQNAIRNPLTAATSSATAFAASLGTAGVALVGFATGVVVVGVALGKLALGFGEFAEQIQLLSDRTGLTVTEALEFSGVAKVVGVDIGSLTTSMKRLSEALAGNDDVGKLARQTLEQIGVKAFDSQGKIKPLGGIFEDIARGLNRLDSTAAQRLALDRIIGRGAGELLPFFKQLQELLPAVRATGVGALADLTVGAAKFDDAVDLMILRLKTLGHQLGAKAISAVGTIGGLFGRRLVGTGPSVTLDLPKIQLPKIDEEGIKRRADAEKAAHEVLLQARIQEATGLGRVVQEHQKQIEKIGLTKKAVQELNQAFSLLFSAAVHKLASDNLKEIRQLVQDINDKEREAADRRAKSFTDGLEFTRETLARQIDNLDALLDAERDSAERSRELELAQLESQATRTVAEKLSLEQQKLVIETTFIDKVTVLELERIKRISDREIAEIIRIGELRVRAGQINAEDLYQAIEAGRTAAEQAGEKVSADATDRGKERVLRAQAAQFQIIRDSNERLFEHLKDTSGRVFDAMLQGGQNVWNVFKNAALTALREIVSSTVARALMGMFGGSPVGVGAGTGGGGILGRLGAIFGPGALAVGGGPGGTPPFNPGAGTGLPAGIGGIGGAGGLGGVAGLAGLAPLLGLGGAALGLRGAFAAGQSGNRGLRAAAPAIGVASGLLGFGALASIFPALIGAGPIGWIIAGGIGGFVGLMGILRKSAEQKVIDKVRDLYNLTIDKGMARTITEIARQNFGANLDLAIRSPQIRELLDLYAMSTAQRFSGALPRPTVGVFAQTQGSIFQMSGGSPIFSSMASTPGAGITEKLDQLIAATMAQKQTSVEIDGREVVTATTRATAGSWKRRAGLALQLAPGTVTD